jgi:hypothetical protein
MSFRESYTRLTAPQHVQLTHFSKHEKIEGYFENRDVAEFMGSDRLLRLDTIYGTIQLGYDPKRGQSFLFANIKTSILDTAASRHQKVLKEYQAMRALRTGTQNVAYSAKRRAGSAVILYKMENQPWTQRSITPYLKHVNMETLGKTMPFMEKATDISEREKTMREQRELQAEIRGKAAQGKFSEQGGLRARQTALAQRQNELNALIYRKNTQERLFFRKINFALDIQKHEMFAYYRDRRRSGGKAAKDTAQTENKPTEGKDE